MKLLGEFLFGSRCSWKSLFQTSVFQTYQLLECVWQSHTHYFSLLSATFIDRKLVFSCSNGRHGWLLNKGKSNCQNLPLGTAYRMRSVEMDQATAYGCAHSSTCYIRSVDFQTCRVRGYVSAQGDSSTSAVQL